MRAPAKLTMMRLDVETLRKRVIDRRKAEAGLRSVDDLFPGLRADTEDAARRAVFEAIITDLAELPDALDRQLAALLRD